MKLKKFIQIAENLENQGLAWFARIGANGDDGVIYFRISSYSAMDSAKAFHHAQETEEAFICARIRSSFDMDAQSYTVRMLVPGIYKRGAK